MVHNKGLLFVILVIILVTNCGTGKVAAQDTNLDHLQNTFYMVYEVKEGDSLIKIAQQFAISLDGLCWANGISETNLVRAGDKLLIPSLLQRELPPLNERINPVWTPDLKLESGQYPICFYNKLPNVQLSPDKTVLYHVRQGDTLYDLAREFNTQVTYLQALNKLEATYLKQGQKIYLPIHNLTPRQVLKRTISPADYDLLAKVIYAEARGEPYIGQVAVGAVVLNRVLSPIYPSTISGVVYQPEQFACITDGQIRLAPNEIAYKAAQDALDGLDPTRGSLYYYNPKTAVRTWWLETREVTVVIGNHLFAR